MKSKLGLTLLVLAAWAGAFVLMHRHFRSTIDSYGFNSIDSHLSMSAPEPAGEIVAGFELQAQLAPLDATLLAVYAKAPVCVALQMASYGNRKNEGSIQITLLANAKKQSRDIPAVQVQDNRIRVECFDQLQYSDLQASSGLLTVRGVDGKPGTAVTAWLSQAEGSALTVINGQPSKAGLVYALGRFLDTTGERLAAWVLMATGSLIAAIVLVLGLSGGATKRR